MPKIILDKSKCIGCGTCWDLCDKFFKADEDNKSSLKNSSNGQEVEVEEIGCAQLAADTCPVQCITIK